MGLSRRELLAGAAAAAGHLRASTAKPERPNVVMFMTDDHGAWATGAYGCDGIYTPHIDRLAATGARFTRAFACTPVCSPSRMTYMTGALPSRHHVQDWLIPEDSFGSASRRWLEGFRTFPEVLAANGYSLGMCGKWHMGDDGKAQAGFSYWATVPGGGGPYTDAEFVHNGVRRKMAGFKTDVQTDFALDFLDRFHRQPFFLFVPFYAPHTPYNFQPEVDRKHYAESRFSCFPDLPPHPWQNKGLARMHGTREAKLAYSALVSGVDRNVGRVLEKLEKLGVRQNTLVIFTADQGWNAGHHGVWGKGNGTVPFNMYEQSIQVPLIWNHSGRIRGGETPGPMVSSYDFFPSLLDYLGMKAPPDARRIGRSYAPFLRGAKPSWRNRLFFEYAYVRALRTETLKYIERTEGYPSELYDLESDPGETRNVLGDGAYARALVDLRSELRDFFEKAGAPPLDDWRTTTTQKLPAESRRGKTENREASRD
ncbi:MAG: sulfatase-like hydrolase/transferase [Bryobacteraceae bacterium]|nr:sulfatase-like hydrolase/transferase [Bryobacterales bacterium]NUN01956.1 sulfatase-like hydrolase/transferase [Bryobacteraceae bacterium]